jgi:predicted lipid-binding transport protein (Tim44 family)
VVRGTWTAPHRTAGAPRELKEGQMMDHMGGMMGGMGLLWVLILVLVILGIAALIKYLRSRS